jgi:hypothetical protein
MPINRRSDLTLDILIATHTSVPVLISGAPDDTMRVAMVIANGSSNGQRSAIAAAPATSARLVPAMMDDDPVHRDAHRVVLLRDIETLAGREQEWLIETILTRCRTAAPPDWRLIATTSVPLVDQVTTGVFAPRLFYLLNAIHIMV